jgi:aspartate/glutamate racemase
MHIIADQVRENSPAKLIDIIDETGRALRNAGASRPLLLATRYSMEHGFYHQRMMELHGIDLLVPDAAGRDAMHAIIFEELSEGKVRVSARSKDPAIDVCKICQMFKGGGHPMASGARVRGTVEQVKKDFLKIVCDEIRKRD